MIIFKSGLQRLLHAGQAFLHPIIGLAQQHRLAAKAVAVCLVGVLSLGTAVFSTGITFGFKVDYLGSVIATIKDTGIFEEAKTIALRNVEGHDAARVIATPGFRLTLTVQNQLDNALQLADAILENTEEIVEASALTVNGETLVCTAWDGMSAYLEQARTRFDLAGAENVSVFADKPEVVSGYYVESELSDPAAAQAIIDSLEVKTTAIIRTEYEVPFSKKTVKTSSQFVGYCKVTTAGKNGINRKTEEVQLVNGQEISKQITADEIVSAPVEEITSVGTANPTTKSEQRAAVQKAGLAFPLPAGSYTVSAYYGDGRGHKGVDLAAKSGTPIYAAAAGTVIQAKYDGNYGNSVVIDHGNGMKTRYAHASAIKVSVGTVVEQGDLLALVGRTGQATGNHLHFEVMIGNNRVNPAPYIGLQ